MNKTKGEMELREWLIDEIERKVGTLETIYKLWTIDLIKIHLKMYGLYFD